MPYVNVTVPWHLNVSNR